MKKLLFFFFLITINFSAFAESRIKDIVYFQGVRDNILVGYGIVVGLNGTGDNLKNSGFTEKGLIDFLEKLGVNTRGSDLKTKNIAAVTVTAILPPFSRVGSKIPIDVSTIGDAKSLKGGTLLATPLLGADGEVYALAQGAISIGIKVEDSKTTSTNPTSGYLNNGAIIEKEIDFELNNLEAVNLALKNPDITTARSIEIVINAAIREKAAIAKDPGTVNIKVPNRYKNNVMGMLADIENITIYPDMIAKIIIDEATGTIVIGENVRINKVAIAQGNMVVKVSENLNFISELTNTPLPGPSEPGKEIAIMKEPAKLSDLVEGLNSLGLKPKDLIAILKSIKQAGALQAEIETR